MTPIHFFQLSKTYQHTTLITRGVYVREKIRGPYLIQLYLFENYYYELCCDKRTGESCYVTFIDDDNAGKLFPGISERNVA